MRIPKNNAGLLTLQVVVHNFNAEMTLDQLGELLHDALDAKTLEVFKANARDEKWQYEIKAFSKPEHNNRHSSTGHNLKREDHLILTLPEDSEEK